MALPHGFEPGPLIHAGSRSRVVRARRLADGRSVVLKTLASTRPSSQAIARLRREWELCRDLRHPNIVRYLGFETSEQGAAIVMEDVHGVSLAERIPARGMAIHRFLTIAIQLARGLAAIHAHGVVHKDIKPRNILIEGSDERAKFIDFGVSAWLDDDEQFSLAPNRLEGTLAYISPEQTGRMNRIVDHRADLYSLGVTFYELMCGQVPFTATEALELVHCHLAKLPEPPRSLRPELPVQLSRVVLKLMAKAPEERYQSSRGLLHDLFILREALVHDRDPPAFELGSRDRGPQLRVPDDQLFGRERELQALERAWGRAQRGQPILVLVSGSSGVGKSALVTRFEARLRDRAGVFVRGKFARLGRHAAYEGFTSALRALAGRILGGGMDEFRAWRLRLSEALAVNGRVLLDLIPEMEAIVGELPSVPALGPEESLHRFNLVFRRFVRACARDGQPLVLFLDDLQWADAGSLALLDLLASDEEQSQLMLIAAVRDDELDASHPTRQILERLRGGGISLVELPLRELGVSEVEALIGAALGGMPERAWELAELVVERTAGNPLFVRTFLQMAWDEKLLTAEEADPAEATLSDDLMQMRQVRWSWDSNALRQMQASESVGELLARRLRQLPDSTRALLRSAACIEDSFTGETLAEITDLPTAQALEELRAATRAGLILQRSDERWVFAHDRVREAAHALLPADELATTHLRIGRMLLEGTPDDRLPERVASIVNHLDAGRALIEDEAELIQLAELARLAGQRAQLGTASEAARRYFHAGIASLELVNQRRATATGAPYCWREHYALCLALHRELAAAEYLCDAPEAARAHINAALAQVTDAIDRVELHDLLVFQLTMATRYPEALATGRRALELVDIVLPEEPAIDQALAAALASYREHLGARPLASLIDLPPMQRRETIAAARLLATLISAAYSAAPRLYPLVTLTLVNLILAHGSLPEAALGYAHHGTFVGSVLGDHRSAHAWGELALASARAHEDLAQEARACTIVAGLLLPWVAHVNEAEALHERGQQAAVESGQLQFVGYIRYQRQLLHLFSGTALNRLEPELRRVLSSLHEINHTYAANIVRGVQLNAAAMLGEHVKTEGEARAQLEQAFITSCRESRSYIAICVYQIYRAQVCYLEGDASAALAAVVASKEHLPYAVGHVALADRNFFHSLALAAELPRLPEHQRQVALATIEHNQAQMAKWAASAPANFAHKQLLVAAELACVDGELLVALDLYEQAIASALDYGFTHVHAIANERAARMWIAHGNLRLARPYLSAAIASYRNWGARHKLRLLEHELPELYRELTLPLRTRHATGTSEPWSGTGSTQALDLATVTRASQAISSEIDLERLLAQIMRIILLNAGASRGFLILEAEDDFRIEAVASIEVDEVELHSKRPLSEAPLPVAIVRHVLRTGDNVVLEDAYRRGAFTSDPHVVRRRLKSVLCTPIRHKDALVGVLYLENELAAAAFTHSRSEVLQILLSQAAISLENARYYNELKTLNQQLRTRADELALSKVALESEIAQRERDQAQRLALEAQLRQSQKMEAIGQLAGGVAHDFNNLLTTIIGSSDILTTQLHPGADPAMQPYAEEARVIREAAEHGAALTRQLLAFSRRQVMQPELVDVNALVRRSGAILERLLGVEHQLVMDLAEDAGRARVDPGQLEQVVLNLAINARDASEPGCEVRVETRAQQLSSPRPALPEPIDVGDYLVLAVSDRGTGMDRRTIAHIFEPFFTTKDVGEGTGLGLSTVLGIVQQSAGHVTIDSKIGVGTRFEIWLPRIKPAETPAPAPTRPALTRPPPEPAPSRETILVVEDEAPVRRTVEQILRFAGYEVLIAEDGEACLEVFETRRATIDLVLTDFVMPRLGGLDLAAQLRELEPDIKILFMSGFSDQQLSQDKIEALGGIELIEKPFRAAALIERLRVLLAG